MEREFASHAKNGTWVEVDLHASIDAKVVGSRWVFAIKFHADGSVARFKARLVAQGFSQISGRDYFETYSPVARYDSLRLLISLASVFGLRIEQADVETAYLHGDLKERIHMRLSNRKIVFLRKCLYGLKQNGRE